MRFCVFSSLFYEGMFVSFIVAQIFALCVRQWWGIRFFFWDMNVPIFY